MYKVEGVGEELKTHPVIYVARRALVLILVFWKNDKYFELLRFEVSQYEY